MREADYRRLLMEIDVEPAGIAPALAPLYEETAALAPRPDETVVLFDQRNGTPCGVPAGGLVETGESDLSSLPPGKPCIPLHTTLYGTTFGVLWRPT